jgi:hypothetical protein
MMRGVSRKRLQRCSNGPYCVVRIVVARPSSAAGYGLASGAATVLAASSDRHRDGA